MLVPQRASTTKRHSIKIVFSRAPPGELHKASQSITAMATIRAFIHTDAPIALNENLELTVPQVLAAMLVIVIAILSLSNRHTRVRTRQEVQLRLIHPPAHLIAHAQTRAQVRMVLLDHNNTLSSRNTVLDSHLPHRQRLSPVTQHRLQVRCHHLHCPHPDLTTRFHVRHALPRCLKDRFYLLQSAANLAMTAILLRCLIVLV